MRLATRPWLPLAVALAAACGSGGGGGSAPSPSPSPSPSPTPSPTQTGGGPRVQGTVTFDRVPTTDNGLDYAATQRKPVRGAVVQLFDLSNAQSPVPLGTATTTDDAGGYSLAIPANAPANVSVVVLARTQSPPLQVVDNTSGGASWAISSQPFPAAAATKDLNASSGWTGAGYDATQRVAAPFAILDSMYTAAKAFLAARPNVPFAPLTLNWSPRNVPQSGSKAAGQIGTSHWDGQQLYILGAENADTDEFDDHVIVHEWGHYFEATLSRSDSPGGPHSAGDLKDPSLAFGEGWGNAVSAIALGDPVYRDTAGQAQARTVVRDDMEGNGGNPNPGFGSERSVSKILYDVSDPANDDPLALGLGPIYDVMTGGEKTTPALTSIYSFLAELRKVSPGQSAAIDAVAAAQGVHGGDEWGTGETLIPPTATNPIYQRVSVGTNATLTFAGADPSTSPPSEIPPNDLAQNYYLRFTGDGASHTVRTASLAARGPSPGTQGQDVDVLVYHRGQILNPAVGQGRAGQGSTADESVPFTTQASEEYVIVVTGLGNLARYDVQFTLQ